MKKFEQLQNAYLKSISEIEKYIPAVSEFMSQNLVSITLHGM